MARLDLSVDELGILIDFLESNLADLRMEISHTDSMDFREDLKHRKQVVGKAIEMLRAAMATSE